MDGSGELKTSKVCKRELKDCQFFVDVGSEHGYYTGLALKYMKGGKIVTIEPHLARFEVLERMIDKNKNSKVKVKKLNICVGDYDGEIKLYVGGTPSVVKSISSIKKRVLNKSVMVPVKKLDAILKDAPVDLIKIDVEGFELSVLEGCRNVMANQKPKMIIEIHNSFLETFGKGPQDVFAIMNEYGYEYESIEIKHNEAKRNTIELALFK